MRTYRRSRELWEDQDAFPTVARQLKPLSNQDLTMVRIAPPPGEYLMPAFDELSLQLLVAGPVHSNVDHGHRFEMRASANDFLLSPARTAVRYDTISSGSFLMLNMSRSALIRAVGADCPNWDGDCGELHVTLFRDEALRALLERLWAETAAASPHGRLLTDSLYTAIAGLLAYRAGAAGGEQRPIGLDWRLRRATDILKANLDADIGLVELAARVGLSPRQLSGLFNRHLGTSPHRWLTTERLRVAREELGRRDNPITSIAMACGFASAQHFATVFKDQMGMTPTAYRRLVNDGNGAVCD